MTALQLLGLNLSGGDDGAIPGQVGTDYVYPSDWDIDYAATEGMTVIRLPIRWERIQSAPDAPLNRTEMAYIDALVAHASARGLKVILDLHNFGTAFGAAVGSAALPDSAFADLWGQLATRYANNPNVMFGLMNEPGAQDATDWTTAVNAAIAAIRGAGATQEILVPGAYADSAASFVSSGDAAALGTGVVDPANNYALEVHEYLDSTGDGAGANVVSATIGVQRLADVTSWAEATGAKLFLGEFGAPGDSTSIAALNDTLSYMEQHADVWQGATYWVAGPWSPHPYYSVEPSNPAAKALYNDSTDSFTVTDTTPQGTPDTLTLYVSADAYDGSPQFAVAVDGVPVGHVLTATASHALAQDNEIDLTGDWGVGTHSVTVSYLNDDWVGPGDDRNLYVDGATYDGTAVAGTALPQMALLAEHAAGDAPPTSGGTFTDLGSGPDNLVLLISEDAFEGDAQYTIAIDGYQIGGVMTATASHAAQNDDVITLAGYGGGVAHELTVSFLNDTDQASVGDRNLYLDGVIYDGSAIPGGVQPLDTAGSVNLAFGPPETTIGTNGAGGVSGGPAPEPAPPTVYPTS